MKFRKWAFPLCATLISLSTQSLSAAAIVDITNDPVSRALTSVTVNDGTSDLTFDAADLILTDVTDIVDTAAFEVIAGFGGSNPAPGTRATVLEDLRLDTALLNVSGWAVNFLAPVVNRPGFDVLLADWSNTPQDAFDVTVGATTISVVGNMSGFEMDVDATTMNTNRFVSSPPSAVANLAAAESVTLAANGTTGADHAIFFGFDLTDFGVAEGDSITSMSFSNGNGIDPSAIFGLPTVAVPEPSTLTIAGLFLAGVCWRARRRS